MKRVLLATALVALCFAALSPGAADAAARMCGGKRVTIVGTPGNDHINGTRHADVIDGLAGSDVINGLQGNDTICGGYGADDLRGNAGNDRIYGGPDGLSGLDMTLLEGDLLRGGSGNDTLVPGLDTRGASETYPDQIYYDTAPRGVTVDLGAGTATGDGTDRLAVNGPVALFGSPFGDHIVGSRFDDWLFSGGGDDHVWGEGGNDRIIVDNAYDESGTDADTADGGPGNDDIRASGGDDHLVGGTGNDTLTDDGLTSTDVLEGGDDNDTLTDNGTSGQDTLLGQGGNDTLAVHVHQQMGTIDGGPGDDTASFDASGLSGTPAASLDIGTEHVQIATSTPISFSTLATEAFAVLGLHWTVTGTDGPDVVNGRTAAGIDMTGMGDNDTLIGSENHANTFNGGAGNDCFHQDFDSHDNTLTSVETQTNGNDQCP